MSGVRAGVRKNILPSFVDCVENETDRGVVLFVDVCFRGSEDRVLIDVIFVLHRRGAGGSGGRICVETGVSQGQNTARFDEIHRLESIRLERVVREVDVGRVSAGAPRLEKRDQRVDDVFALSLSEVDHRLIRGDDIGIVATVIGFFKDFEQRLRFADLTKIEKEFNFESRGFRGEGRT